MFVYCPEQWRLEHGLGLKPVATLDAGDRHHAGKAIAERGRRKGQPRSLGARKRVVPSALLP